MYCSSHDGYKKNPITDLSTDKSKDVNGLVMQQTYRLLSLLTYSYDQNEDKCDSDQAEDLADHFSARALFVS